LRYIEFVRRQSKTEFFKQKNALKPLRDQWRNHVDKCPDNQDKKPETKSATSEEKHQIFVKKSKKM
jgi:hypothetical protein